MNELTELCSHFVEVQKYYICNKRKDIKNINDIIEKWDKFVTISIDYFKYLLNFYYEKLNAIIANLITINVLEYYDKDTRESKINETTELMEKYIMLTNLIQNELEYYLTGTVYVHCEYNEDTMKTFNEITNNNLSLMNRKVDIKEVYGLKSNEVKFNSKLSILKHPDNDEKEYSLLSQAGIEFMYYQLITLLKHFGYETKKLVNPCKQFEGLTLIYDTLNDKNLIELKQKHRCICTKNQSFTLTSANRQGSFRLMNKTKVSFFLLF